MSRPSRWRGAAAAAAACALTVLPAMAASAAGPPVPPTAAASRTAPVPATTHDDAPPVTVEITAVTPQVLEPGEDLALTARLTNTSTAPVAEPRVFLHVDRRSFISRSSLDRWRTAGPDGPLGSAVAETDLEEPLAPGASSTVTVTVAADTLGLGRGELSWGPRGVAVQVVDAADPARARLGAARTFALWFPLEEVTATRVSVLVPLVGPAFDPYTTGWAEELETATDDDGRLARVLEATERHPDVTWVLDPWLLEVTASEEDESSTPDAGGGDPAPDPTPGDEASDEDATEDPAQDDAPAPGADLPATAAWLERLLARTTDRELHLLPYLDADVAALAHADADDVLGTARARGAQAARSAGLPTPVAGLLDWPATDLPDLATAGFVQAEGARAVVVGPGQLPPPAVLTYTPSGRTTVDTARGEMTALLPDARLSDALRTGSFLVADDGPRDDDAQRTPVTAAQDLLAELAVITRERPTDARHMLLTAPRDWNPDPAVVDAQLSALEEAPWVRATPVTALVGAPDPEVDRGSLPRRQVSPAEVPADLLEDIAAAVTERRALAGMVADPDALVGDGELELLAATSVAWRARPAGRSALAARSSAETVEIAESVAAAPGSDLTIIATSAGMPVRVTNTLDQDVNVLVDLRPDSARLRSDGAVPATVPANGETVVQVPVHAIQSADVEVAIEVRTPDGVLVDDDAVIAVRVRADWEGIGAAVVGALLALGLVVGLVRSIRRGRRTGRRGPPQPTSGPDALSPEAAAQVGTAFGVAATGRTGDAGRAGEAAGPAVEDTGTDAGAAVPPEGRGAGAG
ncbi:MAG: hypothetical protein H5T83_06985 [Actinotalea sp.]|nr:hypothetical protein [Actinotalea sp.]